MSDLGIWMWPDSILLHGAAKTVSYCSRAGVTDIFFLTKGLRGTAAFSSSFVPQLDRRDLLKELIDAAHERGIRVHAWFTSACDESYKQLHPESGRCHYSRGKDRELISLADEDYLFYMKSIISEVCRNYEIDGLHLDYIRYNHLLYGWADEDLRRYEAEGADIAHLRCMIEKTFYAEEAKDPDCIFDAFRNGDPSALAFVRVRRRDVVRFAEALINTARSEKKDIIISAALMPEGAYEDIAFSDLHYGQNYEDAVHLYDFVLPMAYSQAYKQDAQWVKEVAEGTLRRGLKALMGLHAYEGGTCASLQRDISAIADLPVEGSCLFREGSFIYAFMAHRQLTIYNPTNKPVVRVSLENADQKCGFSDIIAPGEEKTLTLPFDDLQVLQVFSEDGEICVFLTSEQN